MKTFYWPSTGCIYHTTDDLQSMANNHFRATRAVADFTREDNDDRWFVSAMSKEEAPNFDTEADAVLWVETGILPEKKS